MQEKAEGSFDIQSTNQFTLVGWRLQEASEIMQIWKGTHIDMCTHNFNLSSCQRIPKHRGQKETAPFNRAGKTSIRKFSSSPK